MTSPNLRARWIGDDAGGPLFGCEHVDPHSNAWTVCEGDGCAHRDEVSAVRCGELTLDERANASAVHPDHPVVVGAGTGSGPRVVVVPTDEGAEVARQAGSAFR